VCLFDSCAYTFSVILQHGIDVSVFIINKLLNIDNFEPFL
jgi:hypothetical protein